MGTPKRQEPGRHSRGQSPARLQASNAPTHQSFHQQRAAWRGTPIRGTPRTRDSSFTTCELAEPALNSCRARKQLPQLLTASTQALTVRWPDRDIVDPQLPARPCVDPHCSALCMDVGGSAPLERLANRNCSFKDSVSALWFKQADYVQERESVSQGMDIPGEGIHGTSWFSKLDLLPNGGCYRSGRRLLPPHTSRNAILVHASAAARVASTPRQPSGPPSSETFSESTVEVQTTLDATTQGRHVSVELEALAHAPTHAPATLLPPVPLPTQREFFADPVVANAPDAAMHERLDELAPAPSSLKMALRVVPSPRAPAGGSGSPSLDTVGIVGPDDDPNPSPISTARTLTLQPEPITITNSPSPANPTLT